MSERSQILVALTIAFFVVCGCCVWVTQPTGRQIGTYPIGGGRTVRVWSEGEFLDGCGVYFQITEGGVVAVPTTHIDVDIGQKFDFRVACSEDGKIQCVYDAKDDNFNAVIMYHNDSRECYPRLPSGEWIGDPAVKQKWQTRWKQVCDANSGLADHRSFRGLFRE